MVRGPAGATNDSLVCATWIEGNLSFASPTFLWYFMPAVLLTYWVLPKRCRNGLVAVASLVFYAWGAGAFVVWLMACMAINFAAGIAIDSERLRARPSTRRALLVSTVAADVGILALWKYGGFATTQIAALSETFGNSATPIVELALPIGISFFTFHHISYVVDVYRGKSDALKSPLQFVTYIAMFPQLIAGPIVRFHEIAAQLKDVNRSRMDDFAAGFPRFALGLAKKVVIADSVAPIADAAFAVPNADLTTTTAWVGILAFTIQIYFDFSGYSDMAIGLAMMLGFRFPENFNRPYSAFSITDFWRRWHMTLSRWFRDYVYVPLGGNRGRAAATYRNLLLVFVLTGLWHGAAWTFLIWGLYHGSLLIIERVLDLREEPSTEAIVWARRGLTALLVIIGWVFFRAADLGGALNYLRVMFVPTTGPVPDLVATALTQERVIILGLALLVFLMPRHLVMGRLLERRDFAPATVFRMAMIWIAAPFAALLVAAGTFSPFLYFQF